MKAHEQTDGLLRDAETSLERSIRMEYSTNRTIVQKLAAMVGKNKCDSDDLRSHIKLLEGVITDRENTIYDLNKTIASLMLELNDAKKRLGNLIENMPASKIKGFWHPDMVEERQRNEQKYRESPPVRINPETGEPT